MLTVRQCRISIFVITITLIAVGLVMVYNSTAIKADEYYGSHSYFFKRHALSIFIGLILSLFVMSLEAETLRKYSRPIILFGILLLIMVLVPSLGKKVSGARRWFSSGPLNFQPAEFVKVAIILYLADFLSRKSFEIKNFTRSFLPAIIVIFICVGLILIQPDLGTAILIFTIAVIMLFIAGAKIKHLLSLGILALPAVFYLILLKPYRLRRVTAFLDPWQHSSDSGYQLIQSLIALGSGRFFGVGLGRGEQKLYFLPAAHTDFIFSIIGEELGFIGASAIILIFILFIFFAAIIVIKSDKLYSKLLISGVVSLISLQAIIHIGTSTGSIPTKGLPLPLISYGGSSLVFNMIAIALLLNVSREREFL